jgi:hypothetical protein
MADRPHETPPRDDAAPGGAARPEPPRPVGGDLIIPLAGAAFTVYYFATIWDLVWEARVNGLMIGSVLLALVAIYLVRTARDVAQGRATLGLEPLLRPLDVQVKRAVLLLLCIVFIPLIQWVGFTIGVALFLFASLYALGVRDRARLIVLPLALSLAGYLLFIAALDTRFPHGPVERLLGALF